MIHPSLSLESGTHFKRRLNQHKVLGAGFADINAHLIDEHLVKPKPLGNSLRYGLLKFVWVVSKLFKPAPANWGNASILLVPAEPGKDRSIGLYNPMLPLLEKADYRLIGLQQLFNSISIPVFFSWLVKIPTIRKATSQALKQCDPEGVLNAIRPVLFVDTLIHSLWIMQLKQVFSTGACKKVLVDWDRHTLQALVVIAAKLQSVHTYTFVHGAIYTPQKFVPLVADTCLVWGKKHIDFFTGLGEQKEHLLVAGNTRFSSELPNSSIALQQYQIPADKKIILHASQNFPDLEDHEIVKSISAMISANNGYLLLVKSHPSQNQDTLKAKIAGLPNVVLLPVEVSAKDALAMAAFTIIVSSTFSIDAMIAGVPVAIYQPLDHLRGIAVELVNEAKVPLLRSAADVSTLLAEVDANGIDVAFDMEAQKNFIDEYCRYYGTESAGVIAAALTA